MTTIHTNLEENNGVTTMAVSHKSNRSKGLLMRQLQLVAHGEPSDVIKLNTVPEPALGQEDVLISMEAAPINPSDFLVRPRPLRRPSGLPILGRRGGCWPSREDWIEG